MPPREDLRMTLLGVARSRVVALVAEQPCWLGRCRPRPAVAPGDPGDNGGGTTSQRLSNTSARDQQSG